MCYKFVSAFVTGIVTKFKYHKKSCEKERNYLPLKIRKPKREVLVLKGFKEIFYLCLSHTNNEMKMTDILKHVK